jgi:hypothetical protein
LHRTIAIVCSLLAVACASPGKAVMELAPRAAIVGPKELSFLGARGDVAIALEPYLEAKGFTFRHAVGRSQTVGPRTGNGAPVRVESPTRYAIELNSDVFDRCMGGGFRFTALRMELIDTRTNQLVMRSRASGNSEKCPPGSGTVFADLAKAIDGAWQAR